jgi:hypothetical protein
MMTGSTFDDVDEYQKIPYMESKKWNKIKHDPSRHYPNKGESEALRRIMAETGLTEDEVRENVVYRRILAESSKEGQKGKRTPEERYYYNIIKSACKDTGLAKEHPKTLEVIQKLLDDSRKRSFSPWFVRFSVQSAQSVIKNYGEKK